MNMENRFKYIHKIMKLTAGENKTKMVLGADSPKRSSK